MEYSEVWKMGKRIIPRRRGRGGSHYRSPSHRHLGAVSYPRTEGEGVVLDIMHSPGHTSPVAQLSAVPQVLPIVAPGPIVVAPGVVDTTSKEVCIALRPPGADLT